MKTIRCGQCRAEFTDAEIEGKVACPMCNTTIKPMAMSDDVSIKINWQELQVLGIWAENWAKQCEDAAMIQSVSIITDQIEKQYPIRAPLTLTKVVRDLKQLYPSVELIDSKSRKG